jgi:NADPH:quinone reductase-like Zn-dependent oxidoreductase
MTRPKRILAIAALIVVALAGTLAAALSYDVPCDAPRALAGNATAMRAVVYRCYGSPSVLELAAIEKPVAADHQVLVKVLSAALNPLEWHYMRGSPYIMRMSSGLGRPDNPRFGTDFAGTVEAVGKKVTRFKPGDAVFGSRRGALSEYITVSETGALALKPANVTFEEAAGVGIAAITALQALRDFGHARPGDKVLINGASGGVGTFAVQIAKTLGAEVTAVCSTRNAELVRSLGADHVIDYTHENFTQLGQRYDLILDNVGTQSLSDMRRVLQPDGMLVMIGGVTKGPWLGPMLLPLQAALMSPFVDEQMSFMLAEMNQADLIALGELIRAGKVKTIIDRRYTLQEVAAAVEYLEAGHARGKVIVNLQ